MPAPRPLGHQQLTVSTTALALTVPRGASFARIQPSQAIRIRDDGTDPTSAIGLLVAANATHDYSGNLRALKVIRQGGVDAVTDVAYYDHDPGAH